MRWSELTMPALPELVGVARVMAAAASEVANLAEARVHDVRTCVSEAVTNAIQAHARAGVESPVRLRIGMDPTRILIEVHDLGPGLEHSRAEHAEMPDPGELEWLAEGGYGLPVMQALADEVHVSTPEDGSPGSVVSLSFLLDGDGARG